MQRTMLTWAAALALASALYAETYQGAMQQARSLLEAQQQPALAAPVFEAALALATNAADARAARAGLGVSLARAGRQSGEPAQEARGQSLIRDVLADPQTPPDLRALCLEAVAAGQARALRFEDARAAYQTIAGLDGAPARSRAQAWIGTGQAEYDLGRFPLAREAFERARALAQEGAGWNAAQRAALLAEAHRGLGRTASAEGRYDEAVAAYRALAQAAWADEKTRAGARLLAAHALYEGERFADACPEYLALWETLGGAARRLVVGRLDGIYRAQLQKADALLAAGQPAAARAEYERLLGMDRAEPHHLASARLGLGNAWASEKKYAEAAAAYEQVLGMNGAHWPDRGRAQRGLAAALAAQGKRAEARQAYQRLLAMKHAAPSDLAAARTALNMP